MPVIPETDVDLYSDEVILDPYPAYRALRDLGPVVRLVSQDLYAIARYDDVRDALRNHAVFSSAQGISADDTAARKAIGTLIASDPPDHDRLRKAMMVPLSPSSISRLRDEVMTAADAIVERLVARSEFEVVSDLAQALPLSIVSHMVGLPEQGRENMLSWASATFDVLGAANERAQRAIPKVLEMREYAASIAQRGRVTAGGWADRLFDMADAGDIEHARLPSLFRDFMAPSLDTTILATASLVFHLASNPDQWSALKADPSLVRGAINEAVRMESPVRAFARVTTGETMVDGLPIPAGARVLMIYASANRDERKWDRPDAFDVRRRNADHLGFGFGVHSCAGMHLARLEIECLLHAMLARIDRLEVSEPRWAMNNTLRGLEHLRARVVAP